MDIKLNNIDFSVEKLISELNKKQIEFSLLHGRRFRIHNNGKTYYVALNAINRALLTEIPQHTLNEQNLQELKKLQVMVNSLAEAGYCDGLKNKNPLIQLITRIKHFFAARWRKKALHSIDQMHLTVSPPIASKTLLPETTINIQPSHEITSSLKTSIKDDYAKNTQPSKGGFSNNGTTCFLGTSLHCLNVVLDLFPQHIKEFQKTPDETDQHFTDRKELAATIVNYLSQSNSGKTITGQKMQELQNKLAQFDSQVPADGTSDSQNTLRVLLDNVFMTPPFAIGSLNSAGVFVGSPQNMYAIFKADAWNRIFSSSTPNSCQSLYEIRQQGKHESPPVIIFNFPSSCPKGAVKIPDILDFKNGKYELVGCSIGGNHAYAYYKENGQWIKYDDSKVTACSSQEAEQDIHQKRSIVIYKKIH